MKKTLILAIVLALVPAVSYSGSKATTKSSGSTIAVMKNQKGQTTGTLRNQQNKVQILNKSGFVEGWVDKKSGRTFDKRGFSTGSITPVK